MSEANIKNAIDPLAEALDRLTIHVKKATPTTPASRAVEDEIRKLIRDARELLESS